MTETSMSSRPTSVDEVSSLVRRAQQESLPLTVVSGGHGPWSHDPDAPGLRIELGELTDIRVDGTRVSVGGGATWGAVAAALAQHGLAISSGDTASVGVGGLTLGGGIGWMVRAWGLAVDQLVGAQIVTASGDVVETSENAHPELFWALRGGGGNFGIVTRFDFEAHRLPGIVFGEYAVSGDAGAVLRVARDVLRDAPRELTVTFMDVPAMDPSAPAGASLNAVWAGSDPEQLRAVMAPVAALDAVTEKISTPRYRDILMEMPAPEAEAPAGPPGFIGGNGLFAEVKDELIDRLVAFRAAYPASIIFLRSLGGAFGDVAQDATAFPARSASWFVMAGAFDIPGLVDDAARAAIRADWQLIESGRLAEYGNFADSERPEAVPGMFAAAGYARLRAVKAQWDPQNVFRRNHNIVA
ncbi:FAD-binding protein [Microbacterium sp.]|uniref:FAD-binding oxidoreductase n=1 Tax=Microbacterium sp. TaxID=51671 RepID=UPI002811367A|nr:FAD-binding protein [Microbacterium sp.]